MDLTYPPYLMYLTYRRGSLRQRAEHFR
jgi:hypothetical protein